MTKAADKSVYLAKLYNVLHSNDERQFAEVAGKISGEHTNSLEALRQVARQLTEKQFSEFVTVGEFSEPVKLSAQAMELVHGGGFFKDLWNGLVDGCQDYFDGQLSSGGTFGYQLGHAIGFGLTSSNEAPCL